MQCTLTLIRELKAPVGSMYAFGTEVAKAALVEGDPRSLSFPPLFRLSCGATYDPSAGRMQCLGTPTELCTSIRQGPGKKTRADGKPEVGSIKRNSS